MPALEEKAYAVTEEESARISILKIWFTIMVVFIHAYAEQESFGDGSVVYHVPMWLYWVKYIVSFSVSSCAVPGFFFLSAVFLYRKDFTWWDNICRKVRTLLIPYLIMITLWVVIVFCGEHISFTRVFFAREQDIVAEWGILGWFGAYTGYGRMPFYQPLLHTMWFVRDLMLLNITAPAIKAVIDWAPKTVFVLLMVIAFAFGSLNYPLVRRYALTSFCFGYYFVKCDIHFSDIDKLAPLPLGCLYMVAIALTCVAKGGVFERVALPVCAFVGIAFFFRCATAIKNEVWKRRLLWASGFSMPVYLFQEKALTIFRRLAARLLPQTALIQTVEYFGIPAVIIFLCIVCSMLFKRIAPRLYTTVTGGR